MWKLVLLTAVLAAALIKPADGRQARSARPPAAPRRPPALALVQPTGLAVDGDGNLFVSDIGAHRVLKLDLRGVLSAVAGTGEGGFSGDGSPALKARLFAPHDLALDARGNLFVADTYNHRIRRVDRNGIITTVAGSGRSGYTGDRGPAVKASLDNPQGIAFHPDGSLLIADTYNHVVRRVDPQGVITTFAGTEAGLAGDGGPAAKAQLSLPTAVAVAPDGNVTISEAGNNRLRRVNPEGVIETVMGSGSGSGTAGAGFGGDGGPPQKARLFAPADVEFNPSGDLFLSDSGNHRVRRLSGGVVTTIAGSGAPGFGGDGGNATGAALNTPQKIAVASDGTVYIADRANRRIRRVDTAGQIETVGAR